LFRTLLALVAVSALIAFPTRIAGATQSPAATRPALAPDAGAIVNLNTASAKDLETLPGIGAKTALRIVDYRQKNGPFKKIEDLMNVQGIGEKSFLKLKPQLTVAPKPAGSTAAN
jgi:competence protein ComEA